MTQKKPKFDVARHVADQLIDTLKTAQAAGESWEKPWVGGAGLALPMNATTGNEYRGINIWSLIGSAQNACYSSNQWASYKQWESIGGQVREGERGTLIIYYRIIEKDDGEKIPFIRHSYVFNACQVEGAEIELPNIERPALAERIETAEQFFRNTGADIRHSDAPQAYYRRRASGVVDSDFVHMPNIDLFTDTTHSTATENYYSTLAHEVTHWTGDKRRLDRAKGLRFGDAKYAFEELVAEFGAAFLCAHLGISATPRIDHAQYINCWIQVLTDHPKAIVTACSRASDALDYVRGLQTQTTAAVAA